MNNFKKIFVSLMAAVILLGVVIMPAQSAEPWNVAGDYEITFMLTGDPTPYTHDATLTQTGSSVDGTGGYPADGPYSHTWDVTTGNLTGSTLTLTVDYATGAVGTTMMMTGTIAPDGTMSGTWTDNLDGGSRNGTWSVTEGVSVPMIHTPMNGATVEQSAFTKVDWTDAVGANPPFEYQYEAFSDAAYTSSLFLSGWMLASEQATPGTPPGEYYLRVRARDEGLMESAWSNGEGNVYKVTVVADSVVTVTPTMTMTPTPTIANVPAACSGMTFTNVIQGTNGSDNINGTSGNDLIFAKNGSDKVDGKGGDDCIVGGNGSDKLLGGNGEDVLLGQNGSDSLEGGNNNDNLQGGEGSDSMRGDNGDDILNGGTGPDAARGGNGTDTCTAESEQQCEL